MKNKVSLYIFLLIILIMISGCSKPPSDEAIQTAIAETQAMMATSTNTPLPTETNTPTATFTPTITNTATITSTPTATETPVPPVELTQRAYAATVTQAAANYFATIEANNATATQRAWESQATQTQQVVNYYATVDAQNATATEIASYIVVPVRELVSYPDNYKYQKLKVTGKVFNIIDNYTLQIWLSGTYEAGVIEVDTKLSGIYENDWVTVYGVGDGEWCGTNAMGGTVCQPLINNATIIKN